MCHPQSDDNDTECSVVRRKLAREERCTFDFTFAATKAYFYVSGTNAEARVTWHHHSGVTSDMRHETCTNSRQSLLELDRRGPAWNRPLATADLMIGGRCTKSKRQQTKNENTQVREQRMAILLWSDSLRVTINPLSIGRCRSHDTDTQLLALLTVVTG